MPSGRSEDMTPCFGALDVKTIPQREFSCYPNRPQLAASVYCHHRGNGKGRGLKQRGLARVPLMDSLQLNQEAKYENITGEMMPEGVNYCVIFPSRFERKLCHGLL